jgi:hypothetical protein
MGWGHGERIFVEGNPGGDPIIFFIKHFLSASPMLKVVSIEIDLSESGIYPHGFKTDC